MELKKCPFCGSDDVGITSYDGYQYGRCLDCGAEGEKVGTKEQAKRTWNTRDRKLTKKKIEVVKKMMDKAKMPSICEQAPYPKCNGAEGCDTCEHEEAE